MALLVLGFILIIIFIDTSYLVIWVGTVYVSIFSSLINGLVMSWVDRYVGVVGWAAVAIAVGPLLGMIIGTLILGNLMEDVSYIYFLFINTGTAVLALVLLVPMQWLGMKFIQPSQHSLNENP
jgi:uncharacterized protein YacL